MSLLVCRKYDTPGERVFTENHMATSYSSELQTSMIVETPGRDDATERAQVPSPTTRLPRVPQCIEKQSRKGRKDTHIVPITKWRLTVTYCTPAKSLSLHRRVLARAVASCPFSMRNLAKDGGHVNNGVHNRARQQEYRRDHEVGGWIHPSESEGNQNTTNLPPLVDL